jgi:hypothetical protein
MTIKEEIFKLFRKLGWENVTNEVAFEAAKIVKPTTKWNITHLYYWRKIFKQLCESGVEKNGPMKVTKKRVRKSPKTQVAKK